MQALSCKVGGFRGLSVVNPLPNYFGQNYVAANSMTNSHTIITVQAHDVVNIRTLTIY